MRWLLAADVVVESRVDVMWKSDTHFNRLLASIVALTGRQPTLNRRDSRRSATLGQANVTTKNVPTGQRCGRLAPGRPSRGRSIQCQDQTARSSTLGYAGFHALWPQRRAVAQCAKYSPVSLQGITAD